MPTEFEQLESEFDQGGAEAVLQRLSEQLRAGEKYHELFEAMKMQLRLKLGLPLFYHDSGDHLPEEQRNQLEEGLVEACREVGLLLLNAGRIREGWTYLRPVGNAQEAKQIIDDIAPDESNVEELIEVLLHEGLDTARGFKIMLDHYGVCNSITTYESSMGRRSLADQQAGARLLVEQVHADVLASVKADITQREKTEPAGELLAPLLENRDWLFAEQAYHIDTTHLASTVRFARVLDDPTLLRLALDLTAYGRRLHEQFQYQGEEPFVDMYPAHALYFAALLGKDDANSEDVEAALAFFRSRAEEVDAYHVGMAAIETYIELLARVGRHAEALEAAISLTPQAGGPTTLTPQLMELAEKSGRYEPILQFSRDRNDLLGFAAGLVKSKGAQ